MNGMAVASNGDEDWVAGLGAAEVLPRSTDLAGVGPVDALLDAVPVGPVATDAVRDGGVAVFTRPPGDFERAAHMRVESFLVETDPAGLRELSGDLGAERLRTRVARTLDLAEAAEAHALVEPGGLRGKVVLTP